ncbi:FkbM family methyltransferase [Halomonas sp. E19]|uniref:FkbM family methyltransferase n=1 Tax=Halomonas sp. E19 TaxID=3397247 RepID=UPI0040349BB2
MLKSNVDANNLSEKIICNNCGVGNKAGKARISYYNEDNIGMTTIDVSPEGTINVITVDDFLNTKNSGVDLIKIDVEGMEMEVLEEPLLL